MAGKINHASAWKRWRKSKLMSQRHIALALGLSERTVQNIEAGSVVPSYTSQARFKDLQERHLRNERISRASKAS